MASVGARAANMPSIKHPEPLVNFVPRLWSHKQQNLGIPLSCSSRMGRLFHSCPKELPACSIGGPSVVLARGHCASSKGQLLFGALATAWLLGRGRLRLLRVQAQHRHAVVAAAAASDTVGGSEGATIRPEQAAADDAPVVGVYETLRPEVPPAITFTPISRLGTAKGPEMGSRVWVRARLATLRVKGKSTFVVLRQHSLHTLQALKFKDAEDDGNNAAAIAKFFKSLPLETLVDVRGVIVEASVASCTQTNVELQIERAYCVSRALPTLPFLMADAQRSEAEIQASLQTERPYVRVLPDLRLEYRWLDLRVPAHNATLRLQAAVCKLFRETLASRGFVEIHSPKLIAGESEGGAEVFRTDYFGRRATLAQSPQLFKQMAISADLPGVFEVGPVFRAENSNTSRHLCEFTGLDIEMPIDWHYSEVIRTVHEVLVAVFKGLETEYASELAAVRRMYPSEPPALPADGQPCVVHWPDMVELLRAAGVPREDPMADLSSEEERLLGRIVKEKYGSDLFFVDRYPSTVRPFYTMPSRDQPEYSNSYDAIFFGQEIASGAQRCHDPEMLEARCAELGVPTGPLQPYIDSFRHGVPPHGGVGLGLERIVQLYLGLDNIRKAVMFTRDPLRLSP